MRPFQGIYEKMAFPPYRFYEYPKAVLDKAGNKRIVNSRAEEVKVELEAAPEEGQTKDSIEAERNRLATKLAEAEAALAAERAKNSLALAGKVAPTVGKVETETKAPSVSKKA